MASSERAGLLDGKLVDDSYSRESQTEEDLSPRGEGCGVTVWIAFFVGGGLACAFVAWSFTQKWGFDVPVPTPSPRPQLHSLPTVLPTKQPIDTVATHVPAVPAQSSTFQPALPQTSEPSTGSLNCLIHVSFGHAYDDVNKITVPTKKAYCERHGYALKTYTASDYSSMITDTFSGCLGYDIKPDAGYDKQTLLKWCGVWRAFEDGCDAAMWTDADAVINAPQHSMNYWMSHNPDADIYWSLDDPGADHWCKTAVETAVVDGLSRFASCLNGGVFIMRKTAWVQAFLRRTLQLSMETFKQKCSTSTLNPVWFDQCMFTHFNAAQYQQDHVGDQCVVACDAMKESNIMSHYQTFGPNHKPLFQKVILASFHFPLKLFFMNKPEILPDTFVVNCGGHINHEQLIDCVKYSANPSSFQ